MLTIWRRILFVLDAISFPTHIIQTIQRNIKKDIKTIKKSFIHVAVVRSIYGVLSANILNIATILNI
jgi:hypothetical protein